MRYVPYDELRTEPNIIVDGSATGGTVLTLSHWPKSGTPTELAADTSAEIVFNYLQRPSAQVNANAVSNNHFDEDGLIGIFSLVHPAIALRHRDRLIAAATAGDFGVYSSRDAARIAFTISAFADEATSPLPRDIFTMPYAAQSAALYRRLLEVMTPLLADLNTFWRFWQEDDRALTAGEELIDRGAVTIDERRDVDLAVIRIPPTEPMLHASVLNTRTPCSRLLVIHGQHVEFRYRYEGWVQFRSRVIAPRVDLSALAEELNAAEELPGKWEFDGVEAITPRLHLRGAQGTALPVDTIVARVEHHLRAGAPAWNPFG